jgi:hypothetical protein
MCNGNQFDTQHIHANEHPKFMPSYGMDLRQIMYGVVVVTCDRAMHDACVRHQMYVRTTASSNDNKQ